jgi:hypothetical protein
MTITKEEFEQLLEHGEDSWLDWKAEFDNGLLLDPKSQPKEWEKGKGKLLKDLVSIANSADERTGYLVLGVKDHRSHREVLGITRSWDDADFQQWAQTSFDPSIKFRYSEFEARPGRRIGIFEVEHVAEYPHVTTQPISGVIYEGQVWFRRGSKNSVALYGDLKEMLKGQDPVKIGTWRGKLVEDIIEFYQKYDEHYELIPVGRFHKDSKLAEGWKLAYRPGTRREIWEGYNPRTNDYDRILMLRPKR